MGGDVSKVIKKITKPIESAVKAAVVTPVKQLTKPIIQPLRKAVGSAVPVSLLDPALNKATKAFTSKPPTPAPPAAPRAPKALGDTTFGKFGELVQKAIPKAVKDKLAAPDTQKSKIKGTKREVARRRGSGERSVARIRRKASGRLATLLGD